MTRAVVVTGMSGAGRTSCLRFLEDLGFDAVDNLPTPLLGRLLRVDAGAAGLAGDAAAGRDVAVGVDSRTRGFEPRDMVRRVAALREAAVPPDRVELLFCECDDEVLRRRFSASRRRHPLAAGALPVAEALARERALMAPLKAAADLVVDTSELPLPELRRLLAGHFGARGGTADEAGRGPAMQVSVVSFSYMGGVPREADLVLDVRFLRNPHYVDRLRPLTGLDPEVEAYVAADPAYPAFVRDLERLLEPLLPRYEAEGKSYLTVAVGCTGGRHRSVHLAERLGAWLRRQGRAVAVRHREPPAATAAAIAAAAATAAAAGDHRP